MSLSKKVLIIHPEGNMFYNPTMKCIIDLLIDKNVDIVLRYNKSMAETSLHEKIKLFPYGSIHKKIKAILFDKIGFKWLINIYVQIISRIYCGKIDLVIGVDRQGLIEAAIISEAMCIPYIFISFEITFESEVGKRFKKIEKMSSQNVKYWFVQDEVRKKCLIEENDLSENNCITIPLASAGLGKLPNKRLRDDLEGISKMKKVAILLGSIASWTMAKEIIESVALWPDDWVLIVHDRYGNTDKVLQNLCINMSFFRDKVFVSYSSSNMIDDMGYVLNGISAGIAFYKPSFSCQLTGKNVQNIGFSSGKISTYLRYGVPVIVNNIGLLSTRAAEKKFGFIANNQFEIPRYLTEISKNEGFYSENAVEYYKSVLDFDNYKNIIIDKFNI